MAVAQWLEHLLVEQGVARPNRVSHPYLHFWFLDILINNAK